MAIDIIPTENDVGGAITPGIGKIITEARWNVMFSKGIRPYVISGYVMPAPVGNLTFVVPAGSAWINGYKINDTIGATLTLTDNSSNRIFVALTRDGNNKVTGISYVVRTDTSMPSDPMILCEVVTNAGSQITVQERHLHSSGGIVMGEYVGNGTTKDVILGFKPQFVWILATGGIEHIHMDDFDTGATNFGATTYGIQVSGAGAGQLSISGTIYKYIAS